MATHAEVRDHFAVRDLGEVTVKGKAIPVKIYAVLSELSEAQPAGRGEAEAEPSRSVRSRRAAIKKGAIPPDSRAAPRRLIEGRVSISDGELTVVAEATDLSRTGIAVRAVPRQLETGEIVTLQIALGAARQAVTVDRAEVMWAHKDTAGLRFVELSPAARAALDALTPR